MTVSVQSPHPFGSRVRHVTGGPVMLIVDVEDDHIVAAWKTPGRFGALPRVQEQRFNHYELSQVR